MPSIKLAHIRQSGQDMILVPLDRNFGFKSRFDQDAILADLEMRAHGAGLAGRAAVFWENGGQTHFLGPKPWHNFLSSVSLNTVWASVNKQISW